MADTSPAPDIDPVAMGRLKDAELAQIMTELAGPNPHGADMGLPPALLDDGGHDD